MGKQGFQAPAVVEPLVEVVVQVALVLRIFLVPSSEADEDHREFGSLATIWWSCAFLWRSSTAVRRSR
jgi:hypothetical protein